MGCYDTVIIHCPKCGEEHYNQSKGGACLLREYTLENAPADVMSDVNRHGSVQCECGCTFEVQYDLAATNRRIVVL